MLLTLRVANHRSLKAEQVLSMEAKGSATSITGLYGANASGKSNVLRALAFVRDTVLLSQRLFDADGGVPRDPFAWGPSRREPSLYEVEFVSDGVRYQYGFAADDERFVEEWLHAFPNHRKQVWFERDGQDVEFGEHLKGENKAAQAVMRRNSLYLSAAAQNGHAQLGRVTRWFGRMRLHNVRTMLSFVPGRPPRWGLSPETQLTLFESRAATLTEPVRKARFLEFLRAADLGISDWSVEEGPGTGRAAGRVQILLHHATSELEPALLPLEEESHGTRELFLLGPSLIDSLDQGGLLVVDELEAGLHSLIAREILKAFAAAGNGAQILFTTHDTNLLGTIAGDPVLSRDQVWLTEKDADGSTRLYPLTDFKARAEENLERGYLQGRYGGVPVLGGGLAGKTGT